MGAAKTLRAKNAPRRSRNPEWGYRDIDEICAEAKKNGLQFEGKREMPAKLGDAH